MIRKHNDSDLEAILDVWYQASTLAHPFLTSSFVEKVKKDMRETYIPGSETWVYEEDGTVVGFIGMLGNEIGGLFVSPSCHSRGIGTQLVNYIGAMHGEIEVEVFEENRIGRSFYDAYGFMKTDMYFHKESNQNIIRMKFSRNELRNN